MPRFRVAIIGAGLGGLVHALAIEKLAPDVEVHVFESTAQLAEVGAGIGIQRRVWAVVEALGLDKALLGIRGAASTDDTPVIATYRKADQPEGVDFYKFGMKPSQGVKIYHRGELQTVLLEHIKTTNIHLSKRLVTYTHPEDPALPIGLIFDDGTTSSCDVLIGADGIQSTVRRSLYNFLATKAESRGAFEEATELRDYVAPVWSGTIMYRALIQEETLRAHSAPHDVPALRNPILYCGKGRAAVCYPISNGRILNFAASSFRPELIGTTFEGPWVSTASQAELKGAFDGSEPELQRIIECVDQPLRWVVNMTKALPTYVDGRVAILGDAAHAMVPFQASGAGQAFEDGFLLAHIFAIPRVTRETIAAALRVWDEIRRPYCQAVNEAAIQTGRYMYMYAGDGLAELTVEQSRTGTAVGLAQLQALGEKIEHSMDWMSETTVAGDCEAATCRLEELLA